MSTTGEGKGKRGSLSATQITARRNCRKLSRLAQVFTIFFVNGGLQFFLTPVITYGGEFFGLEGLENVRPLENILKDALWGVAMGFER